MTSIATARHNKIISFYPFIGEFTQQDSKEKRTAKRSRVTNVTGLLLACFVVIFT